MGHSGLMRDIDRILRWDSVSSSTRTVLEVLLGALSSDQMDNLAADIRPFADKYLVRGPDQPDIDGLMLAEDVRGLIDALAYPDLRVHAAAEQAIKAMIPAATGTMVEEFLSREPGDPRDLWSAWESLGYILLHLAGHDEWVRARLEEALQAARAPHLFWGEVVRKLAGPKQVVSDILAGQQSTAEKKERILFLVRSLNGAVPVTGIIFCACGYPAWMTISRTGTEQLIWDLIDLETSGKQGLARCHGCGTALRQVGLPSFFQREHHDIQN